MKTRPTTDDLISLAHGTAGDGLLDTLCREDLAAGEMIAIGVILRGAFDRRQAFDNPPVDLKIGALAYAEAGVGFGAQLTGCRACGRSHTKRCSIPATAVSSS
jgi:hypothetical protein